jgi:hypothetical protein
MENLLRMQNRQIVHFQFGQHMKMPFLLYMTHRFVNTPSSPVRTFWPPNGPPKLNSRLARAKPHAAPTIKSLRCVCGFGLMHRPKTQWNYPICHLRSKRDACMLQRQKINGRPGGVAVARDSLAHVTPYPLHVRLGP